MMAGVTLMGAAATVPGKHGQGRSDSGSGDGSKDNGSDSSGKGKGYGYGCSPREKDKKKILPVFFERCRNCDLHLRCSKL